MKQHKTNAMRLLDSAVVAYEVFTYPYCEDDLSAAKAAAELGVDVSLLYKTLVLRGEPGGVFVCMVPGSGEVDLKKAAALSGNKKVVMVPMKDLLPLTGYMRGGCSPVGMKKPYPLYIDRSCLSRGHIFISAGVRGMQLKVRTAALVAFTGASVAELL